MKIKLLMGLILFLGLMGLVSASDFTPQGNINLRDYYNITGAPYVNATTYYGNGSQLTDISQAESDPFWSANQSSYYNKTEVTANITSANATATNWVDALFVRFTELVAQVGNWTSDKSNYYTKAEVTTNITSANNSMKSYVDAQDTSFNTSVANYADAQDVIANTSSINWVDLLFPRISELVGLLGNWSDDKGDYSNETEINITLGIYNDSMKDYTDATFVTTEVDPYWTGNQSSYSTTAEIIAFGYYNSTDFVITDYFTKSDIIGFGYYNATDFSIADYFTSAEVLAFSYYNSTDFSISDYFTKTQILGFDYYNSTDFVITDYYTKSQINSFNFYNATDFDIADYYTKAETNTTIGIYNDSMKDYADATFLTSYTETDPKWTGNQSSYSTTSVILGWNFYNSTDFDINDYLTAATILGFDYYNSTDFSISDYFTKVETNTTIGIFNDSMKSYVDAQADTNETTRFDELVGNCSGGDFVAGVYSSGAKYCSTPAGGGDITTVNTSGIYLTGGGITGDVDVLVNDTILNDTIDDRAGTFNDSMKAYTDALDTATNTSMKSYVDAQDVVYNDSMKSYVDTQAGDNSSWNESYANTLYRTHSWDNFTGIPHATPSDGDVTHLSWADEIYDWVIAFGYLTAETLWNANYSAFLTHITWANAMNGTLFTQTEWDTNYTSNNDKWLNTTNMTYDAYNDSGFIRDWDVDITTANTSMKDYADATFLTDVVSDTSPQLGGYLDTNAQNIGSTSDEIEHVYVTTNYRIYFGTGQESSIYYNGTSLILQVT